MFDKLNITKNECFDAPDIKTPEEHPFFKHILKRWCDNDVNQYNFMINWFAHLIQKPWEKMRTSLILMGDEGAGKGCVIEIIAKILGKKYSN